MRAMSQIKITLQSDLCNANGEGFASVIDTDIVADEYGIPFIPSRRIKGCLLDAAQTIYDDTDVNEKMLRKIFGKSGAETGGSLKFSSPARLDNYDNIKNQVTGFSREEVLNLFTYTRAATAIDENGSADENSLRFMRAVKQYLPAENNENDGYKALVFMADCELDECYANDMKRICKALRNIGYKRNRGFGAVICEYIPDNKDRKICGNKDNNFPDISSGNDEDEYRIPITLINETPLIISAENNDETLDYIPGGSVLAAFASQYPKDILKQDFNRFSELFLEDNIRFSNCYIGDMPAPLCYAGLKKDKNTYKNLAQGEKAPEDDVVKPLKDKYLIESKDGDYYISKIKKEIIYHNTSQKIGLYTQTALSEGQEFKGIITGKGKYLKQIKEYFKNKNIRVGKSKTAQYSCCGISFGAAEKIENQTISSNEIAVILKSDVLLIKDGVYTTDINELIKTLEISGTLDKEKTAVAYTIISGYSGVYNLKKPQVKAFKAGSVLIFNKCDTDKTNNSIKSERVIGARQSEGFGVCEVIAVKDMKKTTKVAADKNDDTKDGIYRALLIKSQDNTKLKEKAILHAKNHPLGEVITATQIGRFRRMLAESNDADEFDRRIKNIKTSSVQETASKYFEDGSQNFADYKDFRLFWDTVLLYHKYKRKIDEKTKKGGGK